MEDADERAHERVGKTLNDKWTLEKLVGIGGMAAVYAGVHRNGARAAIKVLHPSLARRPELRERFLREGYAANRVNHSGVVKVLDDDVIESGPDEHGAFLVMELLEGESLEDRLERGPPVEEKELLAIAAAVLDVLAAAHKAGVVHRDLKPENLFLARDTEKPDAPPKIKILDFGLARVAEAGNKTMAGIAIGTPSYMPPEQAAGRVFEIDARSDLFAVGATCFRILAGRTVHPGESALAICALMAKEPAPKLQSVAPNVSAKTAAAIDRALAFKREDRFRDATAMRRAIESAIEDLGGDTIQIDSGMIEIAQDESAPIERVEKKSGMLGIFIALVILAGLAIGGFLAYDKFRTEPAKITDAGTVAVAEAEAATEPESGTATGTGAESGTATGTESETEADAESESDSATESETETDAAPSDAAAAMDAHADASFGDGGHRHHRDGGAHHPPHHHHRAGSR